MKTADIWGQCEFRELTYVHRRGWCYICKKSRTYCHPNYCLGPDEEGLWGNKAGMVVIDEFIGGENED